MSAETLDSGAVPNPAGELLDWETLNAVDAGGNSYLHHAVLKNRLDVAKFLVKQGIDRSLKNESGLTAAGLAERMKLPAMAALLTGE